MGSLSVEYLVANEGHQGSPYTNPSFLYGEWSEQKRGEPGSIPGPRIGIEALGLFWISVKKDKADWALAKVRFPVRAPYLYGIIESILLFKIDTSVI